MPLFRSRSFFFSCLLLGVILCLFPQAVPAAPSASQIERDLAREQKNAAARRSSLRRLTEQERQVNAGLAAAEKRILQLETGIAEHQKKLLQLARSDEGAKKEYEDLLAEQERTEKAQTETLRLLWEITCKRIAVGSRDMADWADTDREYTWSRELYAALEGYRAELDARETRLAEVLGRREKLSKEIRQRLDSVNEEKNRLLQSRLSYEQRLSTLRRQKENTEAELSSILQLVESLNLQVEEAGAGNFEKQRGKLPWPARGSLKKRFAPSAKPANRGLGISTPDGAEVRAVAGGKVVHNDLLRGFGTVLIVQHGQDYYSLYAFLGNSPLKVGDNVARQQIIGRTGYYPAVEGPGLYFELRFKQKAINPEQWLLPA